MQGIAEAAAMSPFGLQIHVVSSSHLQVPLTIPFFSDSSRRVADSSNGDARSLASFFDGDIDGGCSFLMKRTVKVNRPEFANQRMKFWMTCHVIMSILLNDQVKHSRVSE